ncbi:unnamed protein product, partial [marine sediment metagenome]
DDDSSSSSFGAVMGSKKLKAVAIRGEDSRPTVANPERLRELTRYIHKLKPDGARDFFHFRQPSPEMIPPAEKTKLLRCYGCVSGCNRITYEAADGEKGKFYCQAANFYARRALPYYGGWSDVPFQATRLCNKYGLNTGIIAPIIEWLLRCYKAGILTDENTGIPISKLGSIEFMETLIRKVSFREGFGDVLAQGIHKAADSMGSKAKELLTDYICKTGQTANYGPRIYITTGLLYAMEPWRPIAQLHQISKQVIKWKVRVNGLED